MLQMRFAKDGMTVVLSERIALAEASRLEALATMAAEYYHLGALHLELRAVRMKRSTALYLREIIRRAVQLGLSVHVSSHGPCGNHLALVMGETGTLSTVRAPRPIGFQFAAAAEPMRRLAGMS